MNTIKTLVNETAIYGISSIVGRVANYLLVPFYTRILLPAEYGIIAEFYAYAAFLNILYIYGMEAAYFRFANQEKKKESFDIITSTIITSSVVFSGLLILFATPITTWIAHPGCERYVYYFAAILAIDAILAIPFAQLRYSKRARLFASAKLLQIGLNIFFNLLWLYGFANIATNHRLIASKPFVTHFYSPARHIDYVFIANLIANAAIFPLFSKPLLKLKFRLPWNRLRPMLLYAVPLLLTGLAGTANEMLSRAFLRHLLPPDLYPNYSKEAILGIFSACYKLSIIMSLSIQAFRYAAEPFFFAMSKAKNTPVLFSQVMHGFIIIACFFLLAISTNLDLLAHLLGQAAYREAIEIVPYLSLAYLLLGVYYNLSIWFKIIDKTYYGTWIMGIGATVTITLNILLVPRIGYWGSVWAAVASYATMSGLCYYWGKKHYPIPYQRRGLVYIIATIAVVILVRSTAYKNWTNAMAGNFWVMVLFALLLYGLERKRWY